MTVADSPYEMWVPDDLTDYLQLPKDGTHVEVIGGEIVLSPGPTVDADVLAEARAPKARHLLPHQVDLVVEVTSRSSIAIPRSVTRRCTSIRIGDRVPTPRCGPGRSGNPRLPQPFGFEILTDHREPWDA